MADIFTTGKHKDTSKRVLQCNCPPGLFKKLFLSSAKKYMHLPGDSFAVDAKNKEAFNQLYYYLANSPNFAGDLRKGLFMIGPIGTGKTVAMKSFLDVVSATIDTSGSDFNMSSKAVTRVHSKGLKSKMDEASSRKTFHSRIVYVDDVGKEPVSVNSYGTVTKPFEDFIEMRYRMRKLTFGTSNLTLDDMPYSGHCKDRIKQMFNFIILPGKSRRN